MLKLALILLATFYCGRADDDEGSKTFEVNEEKFNMYKEKACKCIPDLSSEDGNMLKWSDVMTEDEVYELAFLNMAYGLTSDAIAHIPVDLGWKKGIIDFISYVTQTTCDTDAVSSKFINAVKNLFLYYIIKYDRAAKKSEGPTSSEQKMNESTQDAWKEIMPAISTCAREIGPISITENCGIAETFEDKAGNALPMSIIPEMVDQEVTNEAVGLDIIIDSIWWMFTTTYARCYTFFYPNEDVILLFFQKFREDILSNFYNRWRGAGMFKDHFALIFGPFDYEEDHQSLRRCATAAFDYEGLTGRHLVRPLPVVVDGVPMRNFKLDDDPGRIG